MHASETSEPVCRQCKEKSNEKSNKGKDFSMTSKTKGPHHANQDLLEVPKTELCNIDIQDKGNVQE